RPVGASAPPVKGVLRITTNLRKQFFPKRRPFARKLEKQLKNNTLAKRKPLNTSTKNAPARCSGVNQRVRAWIRGFEKRIRGAKGVNRPYLPRDKGKMRGATPEAQAAGGKDQLRTT
ncbi:hypothetical protein, partial [Thalassovita aquimarina]